MRVGVGAALREPVRVGGGQFLRGVSIGIALSRAHGDTGKRLMQHADIAMYSAKATSAPACQIGTSGLLPGELALRHPEGPTRHCGTTARSETT